MFRQRNASITVDQINFSTLSSLTDDSKYFPTELNDCIFNAAENKNIAEFKHIVDTIKLNHANKISVSRVIDQIYVTAIAHNFSAENFLKLLTTLPVDINRTMTRVYQGLCQPPELERDSLINLAVAFNRPCLLDLLLSQGADLNTLSHEGETAEQELERRLKKDRASPSEAWDVPAKERMLASIKAAKLGNNKHEEQIQNQAFLDTAKDYADKLNQRLLAGGMFVKAEDTTAKSDSPVSDKKPQL